MIKETAMYRDEFTKKIWENSQRFCKEEGVDAPEYVEVDKIFEIVKQYKDSEINRLNKKLHEIHYENLRLYNYQDTYRCLTIKQKDEIDKYKLENDKLKKELYNLEDEILFIKIRLDNDKEYIPTISDINFLYEIIKKAKEDIENDS